MKVFTLVPGVFAVMVALCQGTGRAGPPNRFLRAYYDKRLDIRFESPIPIQWASLAPKFPSALDMRSLSEIAREALRWTSLYDQGTQEFPYEILLDARLLQAKCYVFAADGIDELRLLRMRGVVGFDQDGARSDDGEILAMRKAARAPAEEAAAGAAFVFCDPTLVPRRLSTDQGGHLTVVPTGHPTMGLTAPPTAPRIVRTRFDFVIQPSGQKLSFVQWTPDEVCHYRYGILDPEKADAVVAENTYECDI